MSFCLFVCFCLSWNFKALQISTDHISSWCRPLDFVCAQPALFASRITHRQPNPRESNAWKSGIPIRRVWLFPFFFSCFFPLCLSFYVCFLPFPSLYFLFIWYYFYYESNDNTQTIILHFYMTVHLNQNHGPKWIPCTNYHLEDIIEHQSH